MGTNLKEIRKGKYIGLYQDVKSKEYEIWKVCGEPERWDWGITNQDDAKEIQAYADKHYTDGL